MTQKKFSSVKELFDVAKTPQTMQKTKMLQMPQTMQKTTTPQTKKNVFTDQNRIRTPFFSNKNFHVAKRGPKTQITIEELNEGGYKKYNQGGYASIAEMEKACATKASTTLKK
jgi:hypothetical protein